MTKTIGIVGNGFVGKATSLLECASVRVLVFDVDPFKCNPMDITLETLVEECDIIFICVPTPMLSSENPRTNTSIVESVITKLQSLRKKKRSFKSSLKHSLHSKLSGESEEEHNKRSSYCHFVVRSTVPVGFCERFEVHHFPEFLTERNFENDFKTAKEWVVGVNNVLVNEEHQRDFKLNIMKVLHSAHLEGKINSYRTLFESTNCTELAKYARNCFLVTKISFCNEIADFAKAKNVEYEALQRLFVLDNRIA